MPIHIRAQPGDVAPVALLVGDPGRAGRIAELLEGGRCYNRHRGLDGFTGSFEGTPVSAQTTAMGGPSAAIVTEELAMLGARTVVRVGTCGGIGEGVGILDLVIATGAVPLDGTTRQYVGGDPFAPVADFAVVRALVEAAAASPRRAHTGLLVSEDAFYLETDDWRKWRARGVLAVETEAAAIFTVALQRGLRAGCICLVLNQLGTREDSWANEEEALAAEAEMIRVALRAAIALSG